MNRRVVPTKKKCPWCRKAFEVGGRGRPPKRQRFCSASCQAFARVHTPVVATLRPELAAYLAGLFDGEGSLIDSRRSDRPNQKRPTWRLAVANCDLGVLEWCKRETGVGSIVSKPVPTNPRHRRGHSWQCYSWNARDVLIQMLPYLIIKRERALVVIKTFERAQRAWASAGG